MFCRKCGKEMPDGSKFCPHCSANQTGSASRTGKITDMTVILFALAAIWLFFAFQMGYLSFSRIGFGYEIPGKTKWLMQLNGLTGFALLYALWRQWEGKSFLLVLILTFIVYCGSIYAFYNEFVSSFDATSRAWTGRPADNWLLKRVGETLFRELSIYLRIGSAVACVAVGIIIDFKNRPKNASAEAASPASVVKKAESAGAAGRPAAPQTESCGARVRAAFTNSISAQCTSPSFRPWNLVSSALASVCCLILIFTYFSDFLFFLGRNASFIAKVPILTWHGILTAIFAFILFSLWIPSLYNNKSVAVILLTFCAVAATHFVYIRFLLPHSRGIFDLLKYALDGEGDTIRICLILLYGPAALLLIGLLADNWVQALYIFIPVSLIYLNIDLTEQFFGYDPCFPLLLSILAIGVVVYPGIILNIAAFCHKWLLKLCRRPDAA